MKGRSIGQVDLLGKLMMAAADIAIVGLVEESAANGRSLVISEDGEVKRVPAKDLLPRVSGKG